LCNGVSASSSSSALPVVGLGHVDMAVLELMEIEGVNGPDAWGASAVEAAATATVQADGRCGCAPIAVDVDAVATSAPEAKDDVAPTVTDVVAPTASVCAGAGMTGHVSGSHHCRHPCNIRCATLLLARGMWLGTDSVRHSCFWSP